MWRFWPRRVRPILECPFAHVWRETSEMHEMIFSVRDSSEVTLGSVDWNTCAGKK